MTNLDSIKKTLAGISRGDSILDTLIEFERTLDNAEIFAYKNWILGEVVEGPTISRYWYKITLMYPFSHMPNPDAGLRLVKIGARVNFRKGNFKRPVRVRGPEDWVDPQTKRAKMKDTDIWLVTIELPIKYINRGLDRIEDIIQSDIRKTEQDLNNAYNQDNAQAGQVPEDMAQSVDGGEDLSGMPAGDEI